MWCESDCLQDRDVRRGRERSRVRTGHTSVGNETREGHLWAVSRGSGNAKSNVRRNVRLEKLMSFHTLWVPLPASKNPRGEMEISHQRYCKLNVGALGHRMRDTVSPYVYPRLIEPRDLDIQENGRNFTVNAT